SAAIAATTDAFVAYYAGTIVVSNSAGTRYSGPFSANWAHASINTNNSSIAGSFQNILGSVSVVHIDATTGKLLKPEAYVEKDGTPLHNVEQGINIKLLQKHFQGISLHLWDMIQHRLKELLKKDINEEFISMFRKHQHQKRRKVVLM